jgi:hypothetical protein
MSVPIGGSTALRPRPSSAFARWRQAIVGKAFRADASEMPGEPIRLVWMAPTYKNHCQCPCSYTCSRVPASRGPMRGSPWLPRILNVRLDTASDPGEYPCRSPERDTNCCLPAGQNRRHSPTKFFGAQHLEGRLHPLPLHLACLSAEASTRLLPVTPQGSILGSWRTITQEGFTPARTRGLARPHYPNFSCPPFPPLR